MKILIRLFVLLAMGLTFHSCWNNKGKNIPDVSHIPVDLQIQRFEQDLFGIDTTQTNAEFAQIEKAYPTFFKEIYLARILPALQDPRILEAFIKSEGMKQLSDTTKIVYGNSEWLETAFTPAFQFYKHYFPKRTVPKIITYISEYSLGSFTYEDILGVGLDFYLGEDYPNYNPTFFPKYIKRTMNKEHLVAKSIETLATGLVGDPGGEKLLDLMINNGKIYYVMDHLLPNAPDSIKLGYTSAQTQWMEENELQLWAHFIGEDLLYSTKYRDIRKLVEHSPNAPGMPPEAPGRTANWVGWQIVKAYMDRFPDTTMEQLLQVKDAQQILDRSRYKPKRG